MGVNSYTNRYLCKNVSFYSLTITVLRKYVCVCGSGSGGGGGGVCVGWGGGAD